MEGSGVGIVGGGSGRVAPVTAAGGRRPDVLLCPGAGLGRSSYRPLSNRLAAPVHVPDRPPQVGLAELADRVAADGGGPSVLVGHSMGAFLAEAIARRHPDRTAALVLLDPSVVEGDLGRPALPADPDEEGTWAAARWVGRLGRVAGGVPAVRRMTDDLARYPRDAAELRALRGVSALPDVPVVVVSAALSDRLPWHRRWLAEQRELSEELAADHPRGADGVRQHVLLPCGHNLMWWRPGVVADVVRSVA